MAGGSLSGMTRLVALMFLMLSALAHAGDIAPAENARIRYLLASIEALTGAEFIRNGAAYDAQTAADHLRYKLRSIGSRVKTAEDFILYCATQSSMSGEPYQIRFADGQVIASAAYFRQKLAEFDANLGQGAESRAGVQAGP
jgi:hypothetical protein